MAKTGAEQAGLKSSDSKEDSQPDKQKNGADISARVYELDHLQHNAGNISGPDAIVRIPQNFDSSQPINVVIYNHGFYDSAKSAFTNADLNKQMAEAPANTVLVVPEWQKAPASPSGDQGTFDQTGMFQGMLQDVFDATPELKGKSIADISHIGIVAHSAGYAPTETELYKNNLAGKVNSGTLLDSLYDGLGLDPWLKSNLQDLSDGKKQFNNIFANSTSRHSKAQEQRVAAMLTAAGLSRSAILTDYGHGQKVIDPTTLAQHPIVFKYSSATTASKGPHMSLPNLYVSRVEAAAREKAQTTGNMSISPNPIEQVRPAQSPQPVAPALEVLKKSELLKTPDRHEHKTEPLSEQEKIDRKTLESAEATVREKIAALESLYKAGKKDAAGRVHITLQDGAEVRDFVISRRKMGKDTDEIQLSTADQNDNQHPVIRALKRGEKIERQLDNQGRPADFIGSWWMTTALTSPIGRFGAIEGDRHSSSDQMNQF